MHFIRKNLVDSLQLKSISVNLPIIGVGEKRMQIKELVFGNIKSVYNEFNTNLSFLVIDKITGALPTQALDISKLNLPHNITLADPQFNCTSDIDILIGAEVFYDLLCVGQIKIDQGLTLQKSVFGWVVSGKIYSNSSNTQVCNLSIANKDVYAEVRDQLEKFWLVEEVNESKSNKCLVKSKSVKIILFRQLNEIIRAGSTLPCLYEKMLTNWVNLSK